MCSILHYVIFAGYSGFGMGTKTQVDYDSWKVVMGCMTFVNYDSWGRNGDLRRLWTMTVGR
jgi:hypothetical protein